MDSRMSTLLTLLKRRSINIFSNASITFPSMTKTEAVPMHVLPHVMPFVF